MSPRVARTVKVPGREGLHARPAARIVETARKYAAALTLVHGAERASAKDLMDVLYLAAPGGALLTLEGDGEDAEAAVLALESLFRAMGDEK